MSKVDIVSTKTVEAENETFLPYYLGETPEEAEETYKAFSKLINAMASAYAKNSDIAKEDYFAEAITGLARAKRDFDPTRGDCKFKTFAIMKMKNALNEHYRKNNSIVKIPYYVRAAHTYITNIKTILEQYNLDVNCIATIVEADKAFLNTMMIEDGARLKEEANKLKSLAKNSKVNLEDLIARAEFVPSDMAYDEDMTQDELYRREQRRLAAALVVSKLQDRMTESELHIARGIMDGQSYAEIGRSHNPKRSIAWVQNEVEKMRKKFSTRKEVE